MLKFERPKWLKRRIGTVRERIGNKGIIQIENKYGNKVTLKLTKEDATFELFPASIALSELILENKIELAEIMDCEILELDSGYICISQVTQGLKSGDV